MAEKVSPVFRSWCFYANTGSYTCLIYGITLAFWPKTKCSVMLVDMCRAMEFINALLLRLYKDRTVSLSTAASEVYHETLYNYHTWYTSAAFQVALKVILAY